MILLSLVDQLQQVTEKGLAINNKVSLEKVSVAHD
jgi:hypothetical protein